MDHPGLHAHTRSNPPATVRNGLIYVIGGVCAVQCNNVESYDPATNGWTTVGSLTGSVTAPLATVGSTIFVIGSPVRTYAPATNSFASRNVDLPGNHYDHYAVAVLNGGIHVLGGYYSQASASFADHDVYVP